MAVGSPRGSFRIIEADAQHIRAAAAVLTAAFEDEASIKWILDLSTRKSRQSFAAMMALSLSFFYARGDTVLVALESDRIVGVAVLAGLGPGRRGSRWFLLRSMWAHLPSMLGLFIHLRWRNLPALGRATRSTHGQRHDTHALEWLAVDPYYQRRGIGQMLLADLGAREANAREPKGIYTYTVGDANRAFYERCGFQVLSRVEADPAFVVYHVMLPPAARSS